MRGLRYVVGIPKKHVIYAGNSLFMAWFGWVTNRKLGTVAFDRFSWVSNPSYWLTGDSPALSFFTEQP